MRPDRISLWLLATPRQQTPYQEIKVGAQEALTGPERRAIADAMLAEIEDHIDETISATLLEVN